MSIINANAKEIMLKLVYYGPGLCGKTTSLEHIHQSIPEAKRPKLISVATEEERTLFCDFMPLEVAKLGPYLVRLQLFTVPGQIFYNATRRLVLRGADGVVFVADSQEAMRDANLESLRNLAANLESWGTSLEATPHVLQFNKRDLPEIRARKEMEEELNSFGVPVFETVANRGTGIFETLKALTRRSIKAIAADKNSGLNLSADTDKPPKQVKSDNKLDQEKNARQEKSATQEKNPPQVRKERRKPRSENSIAEALANLRPEDHEGLEEVSAPPPGPVLRWSDCWSLPGLRALSLEVEELIAAQRYSDAVIKSAQVLSMATQEAGHAPDREPLFALQLGANGRRYQRYQGLVKVALRAQPVGKRDALFVLHFVTEFAFGPS